jgi:hypothetical protein
VLPWCFLGSGPTESGTAAGACHMAKLSKRIVNQAEASEKDFIWDNEMPGFG